MASPRSIWRLAAVGTLSIATPLMLASPAYADVKSGVDAWERGDYARAIAEWRPAALKGDPDAQFNMGQAYKLGRGVPADLVQAENWYRRAAQQGHLQAEDNLGLVLFTANRRPEAMPYIRKAAGRGEPRAQYVLGTAHFNGDLADRDWPRAYALTKRSSDAGLGIASARLAQLDQLIPLDQRQQGLVLARELERAEQQARIAALATTPPPRAPSPVKPVAMPTSEPAQTYSPPPMIDEVAPAAEPAPVPAPAPQPVPTRAVPAPVQVAELPPSDLPSGTDYRAPPVDEATPDPVPAPAPVAKPAVKPAPAPAAKPAAAAATTSGHPWRAQLGAFSQDGKARALWSQLEKRHAVMSSLQPYLDKAGAVTRLQAGFATQAEAENFCRQVSGKSQGCMVIRKK